MGVHVLVLEVSLLFASQLQSFPPNCSQLTLTVVALQCQQPPPLFRDFSFGTSRLHSLGTGILPPAVDQCLPEGERGAG